jgi:hypothetical protein
MGNERPGENGGAGCHSDIFPDNPGAQLSKTISCNRKPPQHILVLVPQLLAVKVTSLLAFQQFFPHRSRFLVKARFANNAFHRVTLRVNEVCCRSPVSADLKGNQSGRF